MIFFTVNEDHTKSVINRYKYPLLPTKQVTAIPGLLMPIALWHQHKEKGAEKNFKRGNPKAVGARKVMSGGAVEGSGRWQMANQY